MTTDTAEEVVVITPRMADVIRHMLTQPRRPYCCPQITEDTGLPSGTLTPIMHKMEAAGWVTGEFEPRDRVQPRRWYRFTPGSATMLRRALRG